MGKLKSPPPCVDNSSRVSWKLTTVPEREGGRLSDLRVFHVCSETEPPPPPSPSLSLPAQLYRSVENPDLLAVGVFVLSTTR